MIQQSAAAKLGDSLLESVGVPALIIIAIIGVLIFILKPSEEGDNDFFEKNRGTILTISILIIFILIYLGWL